MFYVVLPYNDYDEIVEDLVAFSINKWEAMEYSKQFYYFDVNIVECDTTDANIMYNTVVSEYGVRIDCDSAILKYRSVINSNKYYLYTDNQIVDLYTNQSMTTVYLDELLHSIYYVIDICKYLNDPMSVKLKTLVTYFLYKYIIRVILVDRTDISMFQEFIDESGLVDTGRVTQLKNGEYCVTVDDIVDMQEILKRCIYSIYGPIGD